MKLFVHLGLICLLCPVLLSAQKNTPNPAPITPDPVLASMQWRNVGPFRGGRSAAVTGVAGKPNLFYFGATGGGVWRTQDGGRTWENLSDPFFGGSIGAIEVAASDHNVLYVGGGECTVRGNVSSGTGIWKTEDAGRTWKFSGLPQSRHVTRIRIHPTNADIAYAAVLGDIYQDTDQRGVYRTLDGGKSWKQIHFVQNNAGAVDLCLDPSNPRILYASFWKIRRSPYSLSSGGEGSSLWKSTDSGETWVELTHKSGLPKDTLGIIGVAVSHTRPDRVWAIIESQTGGVFRSDDGGEKWIKVNEDRNLRQRAWYYSRIYADTEDEDMVYVMNVAYHRSKDGGKTFQSKYAPHGDHHDFWVAPEDPKRMIIGDDGGAQISYDGGETWSTYHNQPTAQFYRVTTDNAFPFRIYGAQQDNSSVRIAHRTDGYSIGDRDYEPTAGGESGHLAIDPNNNDIVYGGEYHGFMSRLDHKNRTSRAINVWPEDNMGHGAEDAKYRFQWNYPLFFSPHDPKKLYAASNHLHVTTTEGQQWEIISPDLTTNDKNRQKSSGGPITQDNTSVEYYCTIFAAAESPRVRNLIWTGSDDGLVHLTRNGGQTWENVTPPALPKWTMINSLEPSPHTDGGCYLACTGYKQGDYQPFLFKTNDYGKTWVKITNGIDNEHFTRVIRADQVQPGLLYAGTEQGMYVSFSDGQEWQKFQQNLPIVPITDLTIKENHLIAATQGRSFWMLDDLSPVQQIKANPMIGKGTQNLHLFEPAPSYRMRGGGGKGSKTTGENHPNGAMIHFYLAQKPAEKDTVLILILENDGDTVQLFSNQKLPQKWERNSRKIADLDKGTNRFVWNHRYPDAEKFEGMILWSYDLEGPKAVPGTYKVQVHSGGMMEEKSFQILADPRAGASSEDFNSQFDFVQSISAKLTDLHRAIREIRQLRTQIKAIQSELPKTDAYTPIATLAAQMDSSMTKIEEAMYQTKSRSSQDPLNFPVRLNDKLANLMGQTVDGDFPPTQQARAVRDVLFEQSNIQLAAWKRLKENDLSALNRLIRSSDLDFIRLKK